MTEYQAKQTLLTNENKHKKYKEKPDRTQNVTPVDGMGRHVTHTSLPSLSNGEGVASLCSTRSTCILSMELFRVMVSSWLTISWFRLSGSDSHSTNVSNTGEGQIVHLSTLSWLNKALIEHYPKIHARLMLLLLLLFCLLFGFTYLWLPGYRTLK